MSLPANTAAETVWMIVNLVTTRQIKGKPMGIVRDSKKKPKCVYYDKAKALSDIADLRSKFPQGNFRLLESIPD